MVFIVSFFIEEFSFYYVEFMEDFVVLEFLKDSLEEFLWKYYDFEYFIC